MQESNQTIRTKQLASLAAVIYHLTLEMEHELRFINQSYQIRGIRNVVPKEVRKNGPKGGYCYLTFDGEKWTSQCMRMNARQLRDQRKHLLSGCVKNCDL